VYSVGGEDDTLLSLPELQPAHVAANDRGGLFVLDAAAGVVRVFGADGRPRDPLGRRGRGPGELSAPSGIDVDNTGDVVVADGSKRSVLRWSADGAFVKEDPFLAFIWGDKLRATPNGMLLQVRDMNSKAFRENLSLVSERSDVPLAGMTWPETRPPVYPSCPEYGVEFPPFFTQWLLWDSDGRHTVVVNTHAYEIDVFDGVSLTRKIRRSIDPTRVTDAIIAAKIDSLVIPPLGCTIPAAERARVLGVQETLPVIAAVSVDAQGRLWVRRNGTGKAPGPIDVFTLDGEYQGTLPPESPFPIAFAGADRLVQLTQDSLGVSVINVLNVRR